MPASFANCVISLRVYPQRLVIVAEAQIVAEHVRVFNRDKSTPGQTVFDWRHYLSVVQRKPQALRNGAPFLELPDSFRQLRLRLLKRPAVTGRWSISWPWCYSTMSNLLNRPLPGPWNRGPSKQHVLNCLSRLEEPCRPQPLKPPLALKLVNEPKADTARYDKLRSARHEP